MNQKKGEEKTNHFKKIRNIKKKEMMKGTWLKARIDTLRKKTLNKN